MNRDKSIPIDPPAGDVAMTDVAPGMVHSFDPDEWEPIEPPAWRATETVELDHFEPWMIGRLVEIVFTIEERPRYSGRWSEPKPWTRRSGRVLQYRTPGEPTGKLVVWLEGKDAPFEQHLGTGELSTQDWWRLSYTVHVTPLIQDPQLRIAEQQALLTGLGRMPATTTNTTVIHNPIRQRTARKPRWARSR